MDPSLAGQHVTIMVANKSSSGAWSGFTALTGRVVGADGYAYCHASAHSTQWNAYRGAFGGNASWAASFSRTPQAVTGREPLGHSQISLTMNTYSHVIPELGRAAADRMDDMLGGRAATGAAG